MRCRPINRGGNLPPQPRVASEVRDGRLLQAEDGGGFELNWFRGKMVPRGDNSSGAEGKLFAELQKRGLTKGMMTQVPHVFDIEDDFVEGTISDFEWAEKKLCMFLDGDKIHGKVRQGRKDDLIDKALEKRGWKVLRSEYRAPITVKRKKGIADEIEGELKK